MAREPWVSVSDPAARSLTKIIIRRRQLTLTQGPQKFECPAHAHFFTSRARRGNEKKTDPRQNSRHFKVQNSDCEPEFTRKCGSSGLTEEFCKSYLIRFIWDFFPKKWSEIWQRAECSIKNVKKGAIYVLQNVPKISTKRPHFFPIKLSSKSYTCFVPSHKI